MSRSTSPDSMSRSTSPAVTPKVHHSQNRRQHGLEAVDGTVWMTVFKVVSVRVAEWSVKDGGRMVSMTVYGQAGA